MSGHLLSDMIGGCLRNARQQPELSNGRFGGARRQRGEDAHTAVKQPRHPAS